MAGINAVTDLKETTQGSLTPKELENLRTISKAEVQQAVSTIENQTFKIGNETVKLKDIVANLTESPDNKSVLYKWKKIENMSELWAALQVLILIKEYGVWASSIDWKIWPNTIRSLLHIKEIYTRDAEIAALQERANDGWDTTTMQWLRDKALWRTFDRIKSGNNDKFTRMWVLKNWVLNNPTIGDSTVTINYKSEVDQQTRLITVYVQKNNYWEVSAKKFVNSLITLVENKEKELQLDKNNKALVAWINSFNENDITDPVVKKWATLQWIDFSWKVENGKVVLSSKNNAKLTSGASKLTLSDPTKFLNNWTFDKGKFNKYLNNRANNVMTWAIGVVRVDTNNTITSLSNTRASALSTVATADSAIRNCSSALTSVKALRHDSDFQQQINALNNLKTSYENQKNYLNQRSTLSTNMNKIRGLANSRWTSSGYGFDNGNGLANNFEQIMNSAKTFVKINKVGTWEYQVQNVPSMRNAFNKVGKAAEYDKAVNEFISLINNKTVTIGWESLTYKVSKLDG